MQTAPANSIPKMWDNVNDVLNEFERDDFVKVKGIIQVFHNKPQLTIHKVRRMDESEIEVTDYFPASKRDSAEISGRNCALRSRG